MGQPIDHRDLETSWRALAGANEDGVGGWRTIAIGSASAVRIAAGRRLPDDMEAVLLGFPSWRLAAGEKLPSGRGFEMTQVELESGGAGVAWLALVRHPAGSKDLFGMMVADVLSVIEGIGPASAGEVARAALARVRAWQDFMQRGTDDLLGKDEELGLVGELALIHEAIVGGARAPVVIEAWQGPLRGAQDFLLPSGAIEVKASVATEGFVARIESLEQLDDSACAPLFLGAISMAAQVDGPTLPGWVDRVRKLVPAGSAERATLDERLLRAGYLDGHAAGYVRRFALRGIRMLQIDASFPRLVPSNVPAAVRRARYELDLGQLACGDRSLEYVLTRTGAL